MNVNNMTPEAEQAISQLLDADHIDGCIVHLENAAHALQTIAHNDLTGDHDYLYRFAHELKLMRKELEELEQLLGYHPDRE
jgi:transposase-like protein